MKRRFFQLLLVSGLLCVLCVFCYRPLLRMGLCTLLHQWGAHYETVAWEESTLVVYGIELSLPSQQWSIDQLRIELQGSWSGRVLSPSIQLVHPQILTRAAEKTESTLWALAYRSSWFQPTFSVTNGVLQLPSSRLYFALHPSENTWATFTLAHQPDLTYSPLLHGDLYPLDSSTKVVFDLNEPDLARSAPLLMYLFPQWYSPGHLLSGELDIEGELLLSHTKGLQELTMQMKAHDVLSVTPTGVVQLKCDHLDGSVCYAPAVLHDSFWDGLNVSLSVSGGEWEWGHEWHLREVQGDLTLKAKAPVQVALSGQVQQGSRWVDVALQATGNWEERGSRWMDAVVRCTSAKGNQLQIGMSIGETLEEAAMTLEGDAQAILSLWGAEIAPVPIEWQVEFSNAQEQLLCEIRGTLIHDYIESSVAICWPGHSFSGAQIVLAEFQMERLNPWCNYLFPGTISQGWIHSEVNLCRQGIYVTVQGRDLVITHPTMILSVADCTGRITYEWQSGECVVDVPLSEATVQAVQPQMLLEHVGGHLRSSAAGIELKECQAECAGIFWQGDLSVDHKNHLICASGVQGRWRGADGVCFDILGKRFDMNLAQHTLDFSVKILEGRKEIAQAEGGLRKKGLGWECFFCPETTHMGGIPLQIEALTWDAKGKLSTLLMSPSFKAHEIPLLIQRAAKAGLFPKAGDAVEMLSSLRMQGELQCVLRVTPEESAVTIASTGLSVRDKIYTPFHIDARLEAEGCYIDRLMAGDLVVQAVVVPELRGFTFPRFEGRWRDNTWKGSGYFLQETGKLFCNFDAVHVPFTFGQIHADLRGDVQLVADCTGTLECHGEASVIAQVYAPADLFLSNRKRLRFAYTPEEGTRLEGLDLQIKGRTSGSHLGSVEGAVVTLSPQGGLYVGGIQLQATVGLLQQGIETQLIPQNLKALRWDRELELKGDARLDASQIAFEGSLGKGRYYWGDYGLDCEQVQIKCDRRSVQARLKTYLNEQPLWSAFQCEWGKEIYGVLKVYDHPKAEGLKATMRIRKEGWHVESVHGSCYGLHCRLNGALKKGKWGFPLTGTVTWDTDQLIPLLPQGLQEGIRNLKLGQGYGWQGELFLGSQVPQGFQVAGSLIGHECLLMGYQWQEFRAAVEANAQKVHLSHMTLSEGRALIQMEKVELNCQQEKWRLAIPELSMEKIQPSLLRKEKSTPGPEKPFIIDRLTLRRIQAELGNLSTLSGEGFLTFANGSKKESSLLDLPLEMIKRLGLDLGLLTPVEGELTIELEGDRLYLLSLEHAYSEERRSEFYLAPSKHLSYIDLTGGVHIDLKMRQDVLLKMIEPFTLTIRGTLDKPRYGLQF